MWRLEQHAWCTASGPKRNRWCWRGPGHLWLESLLHSPLSPPVCWDGLSCKCQLCPGQRLLSTTSLLTSPTVLTRTQHQHPTNHTFNAASSSLTSFSLHYTFQYRPASPWLGCQVEDVILWKFRVKTKRYLNCRLLLRMMEFFLNLNTQSLCGGIGLAVTGSAGR